MADRCECGEYLSFLGYASMGGSHSNYFECHKCGNVYEIWDYNRYPRKLVSKKRIFKEPYDAQKYSVDLLLEKVDISIIKQWAGSHLWGMDADAIADLCERHLNIKIPLDYGYEPPKPEWIDVDHNKVA